MASKSAGSSAALAVLLAVTGLVVLIGVILLMMWMQPDIEHSPSVHSRLKKNLPIQMKTQARVRSRAPSAQQHTGSAA